MGRARYDHAAAPIDEAVRFIRAGGAVAVPTETVYGLAADAFDDEAVRCLFELKGRPSTNPLIVHVSGVAMARSVCRAWPSAAEILAWAYWPGPLTLVLPRAHDVSDRVTGGLDTVAVRVPDHPVTLSLIRAFGGPLVAPSANVSGYVSPTRPSHVRGVWPESRVLVLDGGDCRAGLESTVVDLTGPRPRVLRPGLIGVEELSERLGVEVLVGPGEGGRRAGSPGLAGPHYRPRTRLCVESSLGDVERLLSSSAGPLAVICPPGVPLSVSPPHAAIPMPPAIEAYAAELYAALRQADESGASAIVVALPPTPEGVSPRAAAAWDAVRERLRRAAS